MKRAQRDKLVSEHMALAEATARKLWSHLPSCIELEDLISCAHLGLLEAAESYRPGPRKVPFHFWAWLHIRRSVLAFARSAGPCGQRGEPCSPKHVVAVREDMLAAHLDSAPASLSPEQIAIIKRALGTLTPTQLALIRLAYSSGRPVSTELRAIGRSRQLGVGWRVVLRAHEEALAQLRRELTQEVWARAATFLPK